MCCPHINSYLVCTLQATSPSSIYETLNGCLNNILDKFETGHVESKSRILGQKILCALWFSLLNFCFEKGWRGVYCILVTDRREDKVKQCYCFTLSSRLSITNIFVTFFSASTTRIHLKLGVVLQVDWVLHFSYQIQIR